VRETPAGRAVAIGVNREGSQLTINATVESHSHERSSLGHMPKLNLKEFKGPGMFWVGGGPRLGVSVNELNDQLAEYFGVKPGEGVLVTEVFDGTPAEKAGMKAGDVILRVDNQRVESTGDIHDAINGKSGRDVDVVVMRDHRETTLKVTLDSSKDGGMRSSFPDGMREELMKAGAEGRRAARESMDQQRQAMREAQRAMRDAARERQHVMERLRVRSPHGDLLEI
jgi:membrane-associated protease RseP (regulator of RpoE activity)